MLLVGKTGWNNSARYIQISSIPRGVYSIMFCRCLNAPCRGPFFLPVEPFQAVRAKWRRYHHFALATRNGSNSKVNGPVHGALRRLQNLVLCPLGSLLIQMIPFAARPHQPMPVIIPTSLGFTKKNQQIICLLAASYKTSMKEQANKWVARGSNCMSLTLAVCSFSLVVRRQATAAASWVWGEH